MDNDFFGPDLYFQAYHEFNNTLIRLRLVDYDEYLDLDGEAENIFFIKYGERKGK